MRYTSLFRCLTLSIAILLTVGGVMLFMPENVTYAREIKSYTYEIPVNALIRVDTNLGTSFVPNGSGDFEIRADSPTQFTIYYGNSLYNMLPSIFFNAGTEPVSIEYGIDIDVSWDSGFASTGDTDRSIPPSFRFLYYTNQVWFGSQRIAYPIEPFYVNYNQRGNDYGTLWYRNLTNSPYRFQCKMMTNTDLPTYDHYGDRLVLGIGSFEMANILGDDVNADGYGLVFTINSFYVTFNYVDNTGFDAMKDINDSLNEGDADFEQDSSNVKDAVSGAISDYDKFEKEWQDEVNAIYDRYEYADDPWDPGLLDVGLILNANSSFTKSLWDSLMLFAPIGAFITAGLLFCMMVFFVRR